MTKYEVEQLENIFNETDIKYEGFANTPYGVLIDNIMSNLGERPYINFKDASFIILVHNKFPQILEVLKKHVTE